MRRDKSTNNYWLHQIFRKEILTQLSQAPLALLIKGDRSRIFFACETWITLCKEKVLNFNTSEVGVLETQRRGVGTTAAVGEAWIRKYWTENRRWGTEWWRFLTLKVPGRGLQLGTFRGERRHLSTRKSRPFDVRNCTLAGVRSSCRCHSAGYVCTSNFARNRESFSSCRFFKIQRASCKVFSFNLIRVS